MSQYTAVRDNIILRNGDDSKSLYQRIFVVSAYGGMTDLLLENKKDGSPGVYGLFADRDDAWHGALARVRDHMKAINGELFPAQCPQRIAADRFIDERLGEAERILNDLVSLCKNGYFQLESQLLRVRELLASLGESHSAWNMANLLQQDGINARFVDLSGWRMDKPLPLDDHIRQSLDGLNLEHELPILTGYAHCEEGLMKTFDRGYSEMTFSRVAVASEAAEAVIHKEYHLSSADPRVVGVEQVVPIGRTNFDVADHLANLGMEAIHPRAAKGLRQRGIPLRVRNAFEPEHTGTLITTGYISAKPCVEIIAGRSHIWAVEIFDQEMQGRLHEYDQTILQIIDRYKNHLITKDINANSLTFYLDISRHDLSAFRKTLEQRFEHADVTTRQVAIVSAIGSDMRVSGILAKAVSALADAGISILAMHQTMRQVDMQFVIKEDDYDKAIRSLHEVLVEVHDHGSAICAA